MKKYDIVKYIGKDVGIKHFIGWHGKNEFTIRECCKNNQYKISTGIWHVIVDGTELDIKKEKQDER